jgi:hypothetical protein
MAKASADGSTKETRGEYVSPTVTRLGGLVDQTQGSGTKTCEVGETKKGIG